MGKDTVTWRPGDPVCPADYYGMSDETLPSLGHASL